MFNREILFQNECHDFDYLRESIEIINTQDEITTINFAPIYSDLVKNLTHKKQIISMGLFYGMESPQALSLTLRHYKQKNPEIEGANFVVPTPFIHAEDYAATKSYLSILSNTCKDLQIDSRVFVNNLVMPDDEILRYIDIIEQVGMGSIILGDDLNVLEDENLNDFLIQAVSIRKRCSLNFGIIANVENPDEWIKIDKAEFKHVLMVPENICDEET